MDLLLAIICFLPLILAIVKKHPNIGIISIFNTLSVIFSFVGSISLFGSILSLFGPLSRSTSTSILEMEMGGAGGIFLVLAFIVWIVVLLWSLNPPKQIKVQ